MRDVVLEIIVAIGLALLGLGVSALVVGPRGWHLDLDLAYLLGAAVFSVPAIAILELRRRRR